MEQIADKIKNNSNKPKNMRKYILLLNVHPNKLRLIKQIITKENHIVKEVTQVEFKRICFAIPVHLVIVDVQDKNSKVILSTKKHLTYLYRNRLNHLPPLLAIVGIESVIKKQLFQQGALDYISFPVIEEELKYRLQHALFLNDLLQIQNSNTSTNEKLSSYIQPNDSINADVILVEKAVTYLTSHRDKNIKLNDLALIMATNRNKLSKVFKKCCGMTVMCWFHEHRMLYAAQLLEKTSQSIFLIADQIGYPYPNHFSFAFKKRFNVAPQGYRNACHQKIKKSE